MAGGHRFLWDLGQRACCLNLIEAIFKTQGEHVSLSMMVHMSPYLLLIMEVLNVGFEK